MKLNTKKDIESAAKLSVKRSMTKKAYKAYLQRERASETERNLLMNRCAGAMKSKKKAKQEKQMRKELRELCVC